MDWKHSSINFQSLQQADSSKSLLLRDLRAIERCRERIKLTTLGSRNGKTGQECTIDRTLSQLESARRMRRGQPIAQQNHFDPLQL